MLGDNFMRENQVDEIFEEARDGLYVHIESQMTFSTYNFKVLQMQMHQDYIEGHTQHIGHEEVTELFNFEKDLYEQHVL